MHITFPKQVLLAVDHLPRPLQALLSGECGRAAVDTFLSPVFRHRPLMDAPGSEEVADESRDPGMSGAGDGMSQSRSYPDRGRESTSRSPVPDTFIEVTCYEYFFCSFICYHFVRRKKSSSVSSSSSESSGGVAISSSSGLRRNPEVIDLTGDESPSWTTWLGLTTSKDASAQAPLLEKLDKSSGKRTPQTLYQTLLQEYLDYFFPRSAESDP